MAGFHRPAGVHPRIQLGLDTGTSNLTPMRSTKLIILFQYYCTLPTLPLPVQAISFDPSFPRLLFRTLPNNTVPVFDVEEKLFPEWYRPLTRSVTQHLAKLNDPVMGIAFHPSSA